MTQEDKREIIRIVDRLLSEVCDHDSTCDTFDADTCTCSYQSFVRDVNKAKKLLEAA